jgi:hypothetical protein
VNIVGDVRRRPRRHDDRGATLVLALIIITTISLVVAALLPQATTSVSSTVALRVQAGTAYGGDGAAQVAINALRRGTFDNAPSTQCFGSSGTLALPNFYPAIPGNGSAQSSAAVTCTAETGTGAQGSPVPVTNANKPGQAILTLGTSATEDGQLYKQSNNVILVHGAVTSDSNINSFKAMLTVTGGVPVQAVGACTGSVTPACTTITTPIGDPNYPAPTTPPAPPASLPACANKNQVAEFQPGLYTSAATFNTCKASWIYLDPGTYYLNFTGSGSANVWNIGGTVVGGTLTAAKTDTPPATPGACVSPLTSPTAAGVELVMGGASQLDFGMGSAAEFCATYHQNSIPTVVYGLKTAVGSGANVVPAESGCTITVSGCTVLGDDGNGSKPSYFFEGFVYVPKAAIEVAANNNSQPFFNFGIVSRTLSLSTTGSACGTCAFISLPDNSPGLGVANTIVDINAYFCLGASTCSAAAGRLTLVARVEIDDPSGSPVSGQRKITVLSWSEKR